MKGGDNLYYYLGFSYCIGIGPMKFQALINAFGNVKKAYGAGDKELISILGFKTGERFVRFRKEFDPIKKIDEIRKKSITVICLEDSSYPMLLKNIPDPPICLYIKGNFSAVDFDNKQFIAIVGTRNPTYYGRQIAKKITAELARANLITVSGMAIGIDAVVHQSTIDNNGQTIAVLGCGADIIYPAVNANLYYSIIKNNGLVISEFPPGETVKPGLFVARNRIISGLCKGVVVVEGHKGSGALITAKYAGIQGREVFAVPGPINSKMSEAPNILLKNGAKLVADVDDIFEELNIKSASLSHVKKTVDLTDKEKQIVDLLKNKPMLIDELIIQLSFPTEKVANILSVLEIKKVVVKNEEGKYELKI